MSFVVFAALAVALLVTIPVAAHLLRRGRAGEQTFPPAALVPVQPSVARRRSRLEDRLILLLRALLIAALAALGATPLVRCSRLSLARKSGASVALAIVVDDSLSMHTLTPGGKSRFTRALSGAQDLLRSAREGDAVAIVLAGRPARLALAATTDLAAARAALEELKPSDRATDLHGAIQIARSAIKQLSHADQRVVLLSDLADDPLEGGSPPVWAPLEQLRQPSANCGVIAAKRRGRRVTAQVACSSAAAARARRLQLVARQEAEPDEGAAKADAVTAAAGVLADAALVTRRGMQTLGVEVDAPLSELDARLSGTDALPRDDLGPVAPEGGALMVAVLIDQAGAAPATGGAPVLEQALAALDGGVATRPLASVPDDARQLEGFAALILDDPPGLHAEARVALSSWIEAGGVGMALLGPRAHGLGLGSSLEPFADGAVRWDRTANVRGVDAKSLGWLGNEAASLTDLAPRGRALLDGAEPQGARVLARWDDGRAWLLERKLGQGLALSVSLPASPQLSDFALRPGFLGLLDYLVTKASQRAGPVSSPAGTTWRFSATQQVEIVGPKGPLTVREAGGAAKPEQDREVSQVAVAAWAGRYVVKLGDRTQFRVVTLDAQEIMRQPAAVAASAADATQGGVTHQVDASAELAVVVVLLLALELLVRLWLQLRRRLRSRA